VRPLFTFPRDEDVEVVATGVSLEGFEGDGLGAGHCLKV
jgi:hypothetical protein